MSHDLIIALRQVVLKLLGARPAAARRRAIAEALETLAAEQRQLAEADARVGHLLRRTEIDAQRAAAPGQHRKAGARFIRVEQRNEVGGARMFVGRALWQDLGTPPRLDPQRRGDQPVLTPVEEGGFALTVPSGGMPRFTCGPEAVELLALEYEQRYACTIEAGAIVIGPSLDQMGR